MSAPSSPTPRPSSLPSPSPPCSSPLPPPAPTPVPPPPPQPLVRVASLHLRHAPHSSEARFAFLLELRTPRGALVRTTHRYSDLRQLACRVALLDPAGAAALPPFPRRHFFSPQTAAFLLQRAAEIECYLAALLRSPRLRELRDVRELFASYFEAAEGGEGEGGGGNGKGVEVGEGGEARRGEAKGAEGVCATPAERGLATAFAEACEPARHRPSAAVAAVACAALLAALCGGSPLVACLACLLGLSAQPSTRRPHRKWEGDGAYKPAVEAVEAVEAEIVEVVEEVEGLEAVEAEIVEVVEEVEGVEAEGLEAEGVEAEVVEVEGEGEEGVEAETVEGVEAVETVETVEADTAEADTAEADTAGVVEGVEAAEAVAEGGSAEVAERFGRAVEGARALRAPPNEVLLQLYALFKQAGGNDAPANPPSRMQVVARAKWAAWDALRGRSALEAQLDYCALVEKLQAASS
ncbi:hypothetical protein AB1Y20_010400 [Prymnesium parvum]|uniref:ACB domain-containing protein n=1 Tax=Prymnesium parvum TaxID=97485 RepID=A0AB34IR88_PRYPA